LLRCFFPGGPSGLPDGVCESPGFFSFPMYLRLRDPIAAGVVANRCNAYLPFGM
jgi:hypothetical protein